MIAPGTQERVEWGKERIGWREGEREVERERENTCGKFLVKEIIEGFSEQAYLVLKLNTVLQCNDTTIQSPSSCHTQCFIEQRYWEDILCRLMVGGKGRYFINRDQ